MIISDLNYLENTSEEVLGGSGTTIANNYTSNKVVTATVNEAYSKSVGTFLGTLNGNVAEAVFSADATGNNTFSSVIGGVQTEAGRSETYVDAISATK